MEIALDNMLSRIRPAHSGQRAVCPLCKGEVIGKCGGIYAWHWQHAIERNCDTWKEHETAWHRNWKSRFPFDWREFVIEKWDQKHRADVKTASGVVLEFQNSFISKSEIRIREDFYEKMVWVVNAIGFKDNFSIRSVVRSQLKDLNIFYADKASKLKHDYENEIKEVDKKIVELDNAISIESSNLKYQNGRREKLEEGYLSIETYVEEQVASWGVSQYDRVSLWRLDDELNVQKQHLKNIKLQIDDLDAQKRKLERKLNAIKNLPSINIEGCEFKIVSFKQLPDDGYDRIRVILKQSMQTFFWDVKRVQTVAELNAFQFKQDEFVFAVDASGPMKDILREVADIEEKKEELGEDITPVVEEMRKVAAEWFASEINLAEKKISGLTKEVERLQAKRLMYLQRKEKIQEEMKSDIKTASGEDEKHKKRLELSIMREQKGFYSYNWSHERSTWQAANQRLLFDFGDEHLFERVKDGLFKKIMVKDFVNCFLK